jgi:hypothetical protein
VQLIRRESLCGRAWFGLWAWHDLVESWIAPQRVGGGLFAQMNEVIAALLLRSFERGERAFLVAQPGVNRG